MTDYSDAGSNHLYLRRTITPMVRRLFTYNRDEEEANKHASHPVLDVENWNSLCMIRNLMARKNIAPEVITLGITPSELFDRILQLEKENAQKDAEIERLSAMQSSQVAQPEATPEVSVQPEIETISSIEPMTVSNPVIVPTSKVAASKLSSRDRLRIASMIFAGKSRRDVIRELGVTEHQARFEWLAAPEWYIHVSTEGPLTWWQLWEIGCTLCSDRQWKRYVMSRLSLPNDYAYSRSLDDIPHQPVEELRRLYFHKHPYHVFEQLALRRYRTTPRVRVPVTEISAEMRRQIGYHRDEKLFAARFNKTHFPLFAIDQKHMIRFDQLYTDIKAAREELGL